MRVRRTEPRFLLLMGSMVCLSVLCLYVMDRAGTHQASLLLKDKTQEKASLVKQVIEMKGESVKILAYDYSMWDEMVTFVKTADSSWANINIVASLSTFRSDAAWVFSPRFASVYRTAVAECSFLTSDTNLENVLTAAIRRQGFNHFFWVGSHGLLEVYTAPVQPSDDEQRQTPPQGYFVVARLWDHEYTAILEKAIGGRVVIKTLLAGSPSSNSEDRVKVTPGSIRLSDTLLGPDGAPMAQVLCSSETPLHGLFISSARNQLACAAVFCLCLMLVLSLAIRAWVGRPLKLVMRSLQSSTPIPLRHLRGAGIEFSDIAELVSTSLTQRTLLEDEVSERRQAEERLTLSEERLKRQNNLLNSLLKNLHTGVFMVEVPSGKPLLANDMALELLGRGLDPDASTHSFSEIFGAHKPGSCDPYPEEEMPIVAGMSGRVSQVDDMVIERPDGTQVILEVFGSPVKDDRGQIWASLASFTDISERKQTAMALQSSEARMRSITESAHEAILMMDPEGRVSFWNLAAERILGYTSIEAVGQNLHELIVPQRHLEAHYAAFPAFLQTGRGAAIGKTLDLEARRKDGKEISVQLSLSAVHMSGGWHAVGLLRDITERKQTERALLESEKRYRSLVENSGEGIGTLDLEEQFIYANRAADEIFGSPAGGLIGRSLLEFIGPEQADHISSEVAERRPSQASTYQLEIARLDGSVRILIVTTTSAYDETGSVIGSLGIFRDITEKQRADQERLNFERQLQQTQKLESLGVLSGGIAHDFNNILMAVLGNAELALDEVSSIPAARESITNITIAAHRAAELCRQMMAYSGKASFVQEPVDLCGLVAEMIHLLKTSISRKVVMNLNLAPNLPAVHGDPSQMRQIAMNLIINAADAIGDQGGVITITVNTMHCKEEHLRGTQLDNTLTPGKYVYLEVTDTGCGMDAETQARIFEPFFTTKFTGRGLGLSAVMGIIKTHKGGLKLVSLPGQGTTFRVLFPATEVSADGRSPERLPTPIEVSEKRVVLVADDEEMLRTLAGKMIERMGFAVLTAADGREAVDLYRDRGAEIDVVMLDMTMPNMDGAEAFKELYKLNPDIRVLIASGHTAKEVSACFGERSPGAYLQKPFTFGKLKEVLTSVMSTSEAASLV